jgi:hypothetical protein
MPRLGGFFRRNVEEISADAILRVYGSVLALVHVLTFVQWQRGATLRRVLAPGGVPICWPFFEECHRFRVLGPGGVDALLWGYLTLAMAALLLFTRRWTTSATSRSWLSSCRRSSSSPRTTGSA